MPTTGIEKAYIAVLNSDTAAGLIYGPVKYYELIQELDIKPKINTDKAYAENRLIAQASAFDSAEVSINLFDLSSAQRAEILGQSIPSAGGVFAASEDEAPFVALLYKAPLYGGGYRYGVLYKIQFQPDDQTMKTLEGKPDLGQVPKLTGTAQPTDYAVLVNGKEKHPWEYHVETTDPNCPPDIDSTWFASVSVPGVDATAPTVTTSPADTATAVALDANMVWTFSKAISADAVNAANFFLMSAADGSLIPAVLTLDGSGKIVTLNPTANLAASTAYIAVATTNVCDTAGNHLAATIVTNFTTAAS